MFITRFITQLKKLGLTGNVCQTFPIDCKNPKNVYWAVAFISLLTGKVTLGLALSTSHIYSHGLDSIPPVSHIDIWIRSQLETPRNALG